MLTVFFYAGFTFNTEVFRVFDLNVKAEWFRGILKYLLFFLGTIFFINEPHQELILDVFCLSFVVLFFVTTILVLLRVKDQERTSIFNAFEIFKTSLPMALTGLGFFLLLSVDLILVQYYMGNEAVAIYAQPVKIISLIAIIQTTLNAAISKQISELFHSEKNVNLKFIVKKTSRTIAIISFPIILTLAVIPEFILSLFGENYVEGAYVLFILLLGTFVNAACGCASVYMNMTGKQTQFRNIIIVTILLNIFLNIFLIPVYGIEGAAISSSISSVFWNLAVVFYVYKRDNIILFF